MILYGKIINQAGNIPLPGVTVTVADVNGYAKGIAVVSDSKGYFFINSPILLANDKLIFTSAEFNPVTVSAQDIFNDVAIYPSEGALITMQQKTKELENVTVTATKPNNNNLMLLGAGLLLLAVMEDDKKKNQVTGFYSYYKGLPPMAKGAVVIGGGLIAYFTLKKLLKSPDPDTGEPTSAGQVLDNLANQGVYPSYTQTQYEGFANSIVQAVWDCGTDENAIYNVMQAMKNDADVYKLINVYGIREYKGCFENFFGLVKRSLTATLSSELNAGEMSQVNQILKSKGITYQFA